MTSGYQVVLDACVLVNAVLRDTLLRIAEPPRLCLPRWSNDIIDETTRALENKLGYSREQTARLVGQLRVHFEDLLGRGVRTVGAGDDQSPQGQACPGHRGAHRRPNHRHLQHQGLFGGGCGALGCHCADAR